MARRGLQAYAVPSAQAGQNTDPSARRDALSGLMTGGFLMAVIVAVLTIVVATPEYAKPAIGAEVPVASIEPSPSGLVSDVIVEVPTSKLPTQLKGYRWPVRGGDIIDYYDWDPAGQYSISSRPLHGGLDISWFGGAKVKAAHKGKVVAAGSDWLAYAGFDGPIETARTGRDAKPGKKVELPVGVVIDDGNGYYSVYSYLKNLSVKPGTKVKGGTIIGEMAGSGGVRFIRYELVRMDGDWMRVANSARKQGFPKYARERVDPLAVLNLNANKSPRHVKRLPPADPPRLTAY